MLQLHKIIRHAAPSKEALRNNEVQINVIQDLYNQCLSLVNYLSDLAGVIATTDGGYYTTLDEVPKVGKGKVIVEAKEQVIASFNVNSDSDSKVIIPIPTKVSELDNDEHYITDADVPTKVSDLINDLGYITIVDIPTNVSAFNNDAGYLTEHQDISGKVDRSELATVATSGSYNDLSSKPTIPQVLDTPRGGETDAAPSVRFVEQLVDEVPSPDDVSIGLNVEEELYVKSVNADKLTNGTNNKVFTATEQTKLSGIESGAQVNAVTSVNGQTGAVSLNIPSNYAASNSPAGPAVRASSIPYGECDATSTSTVFTATVDGITELRDGVAMYLRNNVVTSAANFTININGLGAKPVYYNLAAATRSTTIFNINYTMLFFYNENRVEGGCWDIYYGYDSNTNTIGYQIRTSTFSLPMADKVYRYRILFTSPDNTKFVPATTSTSTNATSKRDVNQTPINPFGPIVYYSATTAIAVDALPANGALWSQYTLGVGYSFNRVGAALTMPYPAPFYIKCSLQADGSAIIDPDTPYVHSLPNTEDGKIYIHLGYTYSATQIEMFNEKKIYQYKDGKIKLYVG